MFCVGMYQMHVLLLRSVMLRMVYGVLYAQYVLCVSFYVRDVCMLCTLCLRVMYVRNVCMLCV